MPKTLKDITSPYFSPKIGKIGEVVEGVQDIAQCIRIILLTKKGEDLLRPEFGIDRAFIDMPVHQAIPVAVREATQAIKRWEKRAEIVKVSARLEGVSWGIIRIEWKEAKTETIATTEVTL